MKIPTVWTPRQELGLLAATVFGARNAVSLPAKDRAKLKATARPLLRAAIHSLRESRDALRAGDAERQLLLRDRAMMNLAFAQLTYYQPYAFQILWRHIGAARGSRKGGAKTAKEYAKPELDDLIRARLLCGEGTRDYTRVWAEDFNISGSTVRRHIKRIKAELAAGK